MSQKDQKQADTRDENGQKRRSGRRRINKARVLKLIVVLILFTGLIYMGVHLFGKVEMSASDVSGADTAIAGESAADSSSAGTSAAGASEAAGTSKSTAADTTSAANSTQAAAATTATAKSTDGHYVQPAGADWNLKLVNAWNVLDSSYAIPLATYSGSNQYDSRAMDNLRSMISAGSAYSIRVISLYRSIELQTSLFQRQVATWTAKGYNQADVEAEAAKLVARPWTSEHNLGLAADLLDDDSPLEESFENTDAFAWLKAHCAEYGFILRYPKDKVDVTGVSYEPWHYRYVGVEAAQVIMSRGITLEEYLQELGK